MTAKDTDHEAYTLLDLPLIWSLACMKVTAGKQSTITDYFDSYDIVEKVSCMHGFVNLSLNIT